jgi:hypothetical protein
MDWKRSALRHGGGDVLKLGVGFPSGKWQSVSRWGLCFGFRFRFGLLRGVVGWWLWGAGNTLAVVGCFGYVVGWLYVCGRGGREK